MSWYEYAQMSTKQRRALARQAASGNREAMASLTQFTREIKKETNKRLAAMERAKVNYGSVYNNVAYFVETQYNSKRLQSPTALKFDPLDMQLQNDIGVKFLQSKGSTVTGARNVEAHRRKALEDLEIIPKNMSQRKSREFLKFLGNEEISAAIDEYGASDVIIEMMYDVYEQEGTTGLGILQGAMLEWLANEVTFDDAMERVGIKVEDYYRRNPTS